MVILGADLHKRSHTDSYRRPSARPHLTGKKRRSQKRMYPPSRPEDRTVAARKEDWKHGGRRSRREHGARGLPIGINRVPSGIAIVRNLAALGIPPDHVTVVLREAAKENWGIRGGKAGLRHANLPDDLRLRQAPVDEKAEGPDVAVEVV